MKSLFKFMFVAVAVAAMAASCVDPIDPPTPDGCNDYWSDAELDTSAQITLSYCSETDSIGEILIAGQEQTDVVYTQSAAIKLTTDRLLGFDCNRFIKVGCVLSDMTTKYSNLVFWIREELDGENLCETHYTGEIVLKQWMDVLLTPYVKIEKDHEYYIGYTIDANQTPFAGEQVQTPNSEASYLYDCAAEEWISYPTVGNLYIRATASGAFMPSNDVAVNYIGAPEYLEAGQQYDVIVGLYNKSTVDGVGSFDLIASVDGNEIGRKNYALPKLLAVGDSTTVFIKNLSISAAGVKDVVYTVNGINGLDDSNLGDNSVTVKTEFTDRLVNRKVLLENFTTAVCPNCPLGHDRIKEAIEAVAADRFNWICQHAGYMTDGYTLPQNDSSLVFFGGQTYAPAFMLDRLSLGSYGGYGIPGTTPSFAPVINVNSLYEDGILVDYVAYAAKQKSPVTVSATPTFNSETLELKIDVKGSVLAETVDKDNLAVGIVVIENGLTGSQSGASGKYTFDGVIRQVPTSIFGSKLTVDGTSFTYSTSTTFEKRFKPENMEVVVWIANKPASFGYRKDYNNLQVYQSYKVAVVK